MRAAPAGRRNWLRWPAARLGRLVQWVCPTGTEARKAYCSDRCQLWVLCKCAKEEFWSSGSLEDRTWWLLTACGGAVILYWLLAY
jgi:phage baseplate assembly protein gpV